MEELGRCERRQQDLVQVHDEAERRDVEDERLDGHRGGQPPAADDEQKHRDGRPRSQEHRRPGKARRAGLKRVSMTRAIHYYVTKHRFQILNRPFVIYID